VLPNSRCQAATNAAWKRAYIFAVLIALGFTFGMAQAAAVNPDQPIRLDGMELFYGLIPAEILRGHPSGHEERSMHSGVPHGKGVYHLIVSVFDAKTSTRITDAVITGSVIEVGMETQDRKLEAMTFGGNVAFGNYFAMSNPGPYEIVVKVRRPGHRKTATARFQYWHPRR
jgi:hypothetical protein